jgi:hypothetical protein
MGVGFLSPLYALNHADGMQHHPPHVIKDCLGRVCGVEARRLK